MSRLRKLIPAKFLIKPKSQKLISAKYLKKNLRKSIPVKIASLIKVVNNLSLEYFRQKAWHVVFNLILSCWNFDQALLFSYTRAVSINLWYFKDWQIYANLYAKIPRNCDFCLFVAGRGWAYCLSLQDWGGINKIYGIKWQYGDLLWPTYHSRKSALFLFLYGKQD